MVLLASLFLTSCEKEISHIEEYENSQTTTVRSLSEITPPLIDNDLVVFNDSIHFISFYEALDDLYDQDIEAFNTYVDSNLNFVSVGHLLRHDTLLSDPNDQYDPIILHEVMKNVLNPYYEFQIGDDLITYISYEQVLVSDIDDATTRQEIRNLEKDGRFVPLENIPDSAKWGPNDEISSFFKKWCGCTVNIRRVDCGTVRVWGNCGNIFGGSGDGTLHYQDFGLGLSPPWPDYGPLPLFNEESVRGNFSFDFSISESRSVFARVEPECALGKTKFADRDIDLNNTCDDKLRESGWMWIQYTPLDRALSMKLEKTRGWSSDIVRVTVVHYKKHGPQNWRKENIDYLYTELEANYRHKPSLSILSSCQIATTLTANHSCSNCKVSSRRIKTARRTYAHCDGDIIGKTGGIAGSDVLWKVTKSLDEFDCCNQ